MLSLHHRQLRENDPSEILLALSEDERNAAFTHLLQESNEKCDRVIRTLFDGTAQGLDNWEVLCQDRNSVLTQNPAGGKRRHRIGELP